jgi:hypothetical protein
MSGEEPDERERELDEVESDVDAAREHADDDEPAAGSPWAKTSSGDADEV